jgi:hypothetical protein
MSASATPDPVIRQIVEAVSWWGATTGKKSAPWLCPKP